jgi:glycosyltransferase involved in cell wall biosynthesis
VEAVTRLVSVITPVYGDSIQYLKDAYRSLAEQDMPSDWDWEWLVQEDGQTGLLNGSLPDDLRISLGTGRHGGPATARNLALARARGELVKALDADDMLTPGALARDIAVLTGHPQIGWTTSRLLDLFPDGTTTGFEHDPPEGSIPRGAVLQHWQTHNYRAQVHPASLCIRRDLLLALGGWMALPASEDTGLLLAANAITAGYFIAQPGLYYRKWPGQTTNQPAHTEPNEHAARIRLIEARATALLTRVHLNAVRHH